MRPGQAGSTEAYDRPWKRVSTAAFSLEAEKEQPTARVPGAGGCIVLFLLRPLNAGGRLFPRKRHADGFGATFCHQKVAIRRGTRRGSVFSAGQRSEHANKGCSPLFACSRRTGRRTGWRAGRSCQPQCKPRFLTGRRTGRRAGRSCQPQCEPRFLTGRRTGRRAG